MRTKYQQLGLLVFLCAAPLCVQAEDQTKQEYRPGVEAGQQSTTKSVRYIPERCLPELEKARRYLAPIASNTAKDRTPPPSHDDSDSDSTIGAVEQSDDPPKNTAIPISSMYRSEVNALPVSSIGRLAVVADYKGKVCRVRYCTATLIPGDRIITANHCFAGSPFETASQAVAAFVRFGYTGSSNNFEIGEIWEVQPKVDASLSKPLYDIAIAKVMGEPNELPSSRGIASQHLYDQEIVQGEDYFILGNPSGGALMYFRPCRLLTFVDGPDKNTFHSCKGGDALSGGAIYSTLGRFMGIHLGAASGARQTDIRTKSVAVSFQTLSTQYPDWGEGFLVRRAAVVTREAPTQSTRRGFRLPKESIAASLSHFRIGQTVKEAKQKYGIAARETRSIDGQTVLTLQTTLEGAPFEIRQRYRAGGLSGFEIRHDWYDEESSTEQVKNHCETIFSGLIRSAGKHTQKAYRSTIDKLRAAVVATNTPADTPMDQLEALRKEIDVRFQGQLLKLCPRTAPRVRLLELISGPMVPKEPSKEIEVASLFQIRRPEIGEKLPATMGKAEREAKKSYRLCMANGDNVYINVDTTAALSGLNACSVYMSDYSPYLPPECIGNAKCELPSVGK